MSQLTAEDKKTKRRLAMVVDNRVYAAPMIHDPISTELMVTLGNEFSRDEVRDLVDVLQIGKLPAKLHKRSQ